jgi:hypothetical protein
MDKQENKVDVDTGNDTENHATKISSQAKQHSPIRHGTRVIWTAGRKNQRSKSSAR